MRCDVRPVIFDGMYGQFIDPFAVPNRCSCAPEHTTWIQCPDHGCCILTKRIEACSQANCTQIYDMHRYDRRPQPQQIWGVDPVFYAQPGDDWQKLEYIDVAVFAGYGTPQVRDWAEEFIQLFSDLVIRGREIGAKHEQVVKVLAETEAQRELHGEQHGVLCRNQNLGCPIDRQIRDAEQTAATLRSEGQALAAEFRRLWGVVNAKVLRQLMVAQVEEFLRLRGLT